MSWAWSRTFYAQKDGRIFNFEAKRNRDDAVRNHGFEAMKSYDAWKHYPNITRIGWREYQKRKGEYKQRGVCGLPSAPKYVIIDGERENPPKWCLRLEQEG